MTNGLGDTHFISQLLASGGDARIAVRPGSTTNIYGASPYPRDLLAYAASTANDISPEAFDHLRRVIATWPPEGRLSAGAYAMQLERLRIRIRRAYGLDDRIDIVFAPSGTDLEYVALQLARNAFGVPITNILLGADEVGSGCLLSAAGRYFAQETAVADRVCKGSVVEGLAATATVDIPVRDANDWARNSADVVNAIDLAIRSARSAGRTPIAHVVHGSKTGLVLPDLAGIDRLRASHGGRLALVVDACQARIEPEAVRDYLERDVVVLLTGSKFMGGPPFSGFALVPSVYASRSPVAPGLTDIFRRAEWPARWLGLEALSLGANPGLLLRLEAAVFELERFMTVPHANRQRVIGAFQTAIQHLAERLGVHLIGLARSGSLHGDTLATLDLTPLPGTPDLAAAQRYHRILAARGMRLGQPVKCVRLPDGRWGGTLRISLSMPLISKLSGLDEAAIAAWFAKDFDQIAQVLGAATRPVAA